MKKLLVLLLLIPSVAFAAPKQCKRCKDPCHGCKTVTKADASLWAQVVQGFGLTAGFRWDQDCPEPGICSPPAGNHDPAFVGAELRLPVNAWATVGGNFDRDFVDAPDWSARAYIVLHPWRR